MADLRVTSTKIRRLATGSPGSPPDVVQEQQQAPV